MINIAPEMRSEPRAWENRQVVSGYSSERGRWREEKPEKYRAGEKVREAQSVGEVIGGVGEEGSAASWTRQCSGRSHQGRQWRQGLGNASVCLQMGESIGSSPEGPSASGLVCSCPDTCPSYLGMEA